MALKKQERANLFLSQIFMDKSSVKGSRTGILLQHKASSVSFTFLLNAFGSKTLLTVG